jgi:hypothetical protein
VLQLKEIALYSLPDVWKVTLNPNRHQHPKVHYAMLRQDVLCCIISRVITQEIPFQHLDSIKCSPYWNHDVPLVRVIFDAENADIEAKGFDCVRASELDKAGSPRKGDFVELVAIKSHQIIKTPHATGVTFEITTTESCVNLAKTTYGYKKDTTFKVTAEALHICHVARRRVKEYLNDQIQDTESRAVVKLTMMAGETPDWEKLQEYLQMKKLICAMTQ